jgi:energy-converting hydrogenase Eha subunit A
MLGVVAGAENTLPAKEIRVLFQDTVKFPADVLVPGIKFIVLGAFGLSQVPILCHIVYFLGFLPG